MKYTKQYFLRYFSTPLFAAVTILACGANDTCAATDNGITATATEMESLAGFCGDEHSSFPSVAVLLSQGDVLSYQILQTYGLHTIAIC